MFVIVIMTVFKFLIFCIRNSHASIIVYELPFEKLLICNFAIGS